MSSISESDNHLPPWMDTKYDQEHQRSVSSFLDEEEPLLFGTGSIPTEEERGSGGYGTLSAVNADEDLEVSIEELDDNEMSGGVEQSKPSAKSAAKKPSTRRNYSSTQKSIEVKDDELSDLTGVPAGNRPRIPSQNPFLWLFHCVNGSAVVASLCLLTTQIIPFIVSPSNQVSTIFSALNLFLKFYITLICIVFLLVETDVPFPVIRNSIILQSFLPRGFLYSFLGLVATVESYSDRVQSFLAKEKNDDVTWAAIFMQVSAWLMLGVGLVYMFMGILCLGQVFQRLKDDEREEWKQYREAMREWRNRAKK